jgi:EAL domain-containing protein (putative c-di-GMP-specific phosphodiesterase class I)
MDSDDRHFQLVRTIRTLAGSIGVATVAEGVETAPQLLALRKLGYNYAQGFLFSRPVPVKEIEVLLERDPVW